MRSKLAPYFGHIVNGELKKATEYLETHKLKVKLLKKSYSLFDERKLLRRSKNETVCDIDQLFQNYYIDIFWDEISKEKALVRLVVNYAKYVSYELPPNITCVEAKELWDSVFEAEVKEMIENEGFLYRGGYTQGYLGPYIWEKNVSKSFKVKLPSGKTNYTIIMMKRFVSRSWMAFLSFDKIGTGGWAGEDDFVYSVWKTNFKRIYLPSFRINFLKHEAQHLYDYEEFDNISSVHLEYRAKLVELIYGLNISKFLEFLNEANSGDADNSHAYASYLLTRNISRKVFDGEYIEDWTKWKDKHKKVKRYAYEVFEEYPVGVEE